MNPLDASLSLIENEEIYMAESMLELSVGKIRRSSTLFQKLEQTARNSFNIPEDEPVSDDDIRFVFTAHLHTIPSSRTISYSRKGFRKQYEAEDFFETRTLDFTEMHQELKDETLATINPEDATDALTNFFRRLRAFMGTAIQEQRKDAQKSVVDEMKSQGFRV